MTTFRDAILPSVNAIRAIPGQLGWRPYSLTIEVRTWSGAQIGEGTETVTSYPITELYGQPPKTRWLNTEQLAIAGYEKATIEIGPMTPSYPGGGILASLMEPETLPKNTVVQYKLVGPAYPTGIYCRLLTFNHDHAGHYTLRVQASGTP
jgi:hypothetical protein